MFRKKLPYFAPFAVKFGGPAASAGNRFIILPYLYKIITIPTISRKIENVHFLTISIFLYTFHIISFKHDLYTPNNIDFVLDAALIYDCNLCIIFF